MQDNIHVMHPTQTSTSTPPQTITPAVLVSNPIPILPLRCLFCADASFNVTSEQFTWVTNNLPNAKEMSARTVRNIIQAAEIAPATAPLPNPTNIPLKQNTAPNPLASTRQPFSILPLQLNPRNPPQNSSTGIPSKNPTPTPKPPPNTDGGEFDAVFASLKDVVSTESSGCDLSVLPRTLRALSKARPLFKVGLTFTSRLEACVCISEHDELNKRRVQWNGNPPSQDATRAFEIGDLIYSPDIPAKAFIIGTVASITGSFKDNNQEISLLQPGASCALPKFSALAKQWPQSDDKTLQIQMTNVIVGDAVEMGDSKLPVTYIKTKTAKKNKRGLQPICSEIDCAYELLIVEVVVKGKKVLQVKKYHDHTCTQDYTGEVKKALKVRSQDGKGERAVRGPRGPGENGAGRKAIFTSYSTGQLAAYVLSVHQDGTAPKIRAIKAILNAVVRLKQSSDLYKNVLKKTKLFLDGDTSDNLKYLPHYLQLFKASGHRVSLKVHDSPTEKKRIVDHGKNLHTTMFPKNEGFSIKLKIRVAENYPAGSPSIFVYGDKTVNVVLKVGSEVCWGAWVEGVGGVRERGTFQYIQNTHVNCHSPFNGFQGSRLCAIEPHGLSVYVRGLSGMQLRMVPRVNAHVNRLKITNFMLFTRRIVTHFLMGFRGRD